MHKSFLLVATLAALVSATAANAGLIGQKVDGSITTGANPDDYSTWGTATQTIGGGLEFQSMADGNRYGANFTNKHLIITDIERPRETSSGWQMTFQLLSPAEFKKITLVSSNFGANLTYSLVNDILTINWTGDQAYAAMTRKQRRGLGIERFRAVFNISEQEIVVPEPPAIALMLAGILAAAAFGLRRRKSALA
jgi:hypothetical protein